MLERRAPDSESPSKTFGRGLDDGDLVTSGGVTSGIDLALWIVEREISRDVADRIAERMEYARVPGLPQSSAAVERE